MARLSAYIRLHWYTGAYSAPRLAGISCCSKITQRTRTLLRYADKGAN